MERPQMQEYFLFFILNPYLRENFYSFKYEFIVHSVGTSFYCERP